MYKAVMPILLLAMLGCTTPPLTLPNSQTDYRPPSPYETDDEEPCAVTGPEISAGMSQASLIDGAARKAYTRGCEYAGYIDSAKNFGAISDQTTLGLIAGAGVGALTSTHSDFIKAFGALAGLSLGSKLYVNPKVQMATYGKAAISAQCMGDSLSDLLVIVNTYESELADVTQLERQADEFAATLEALSYNIEAQKMIVELGTPSLISDVFILTKNAKQDAENKKQALKLVRNAHRLTNTNLRVIQNYVAATLNTLAFDIEAATKKIAGTSLPSKELIDQIKASAALRSSSLADKTDAHKYSVGILVNLARAEPRPIPYTDLIRIHNEYTACITELTKPSERLDL